MVKVIRAALSIVAGLTLAGGLVVAVEVCSNVVYPPPPDFKGTQEEMCAHVAGYPKWVLAIVVVAWSAAVLASTWLATRLGWLIPGLVVALVLQSALVFNVSMLPYPMWFKVTVLPCVAIACILGIRLPAGPRPEQGGEAGLAD